MEGEIKYPRLPRASVPENNNNIEGKSSCKFDALHAQVIKVVCGRAYSTTRTGSKKRTTLRSLIET